MHLDCNSLRPTGFDGGRAARRGILRAYDERREGCAADADAREVPRDQVRPVVRGERGRELTDVEGGQRQPERGAPAVGVGDRAHDGDGPHPAREERRVEELPEDADGRLGAQVELAADAATVGPPRLGAVRLGARPRERADPGLVRVRDDAAGVPRRDGGAVPRRAAFAAPVRAAVGRGAHRSAAAARAVREDGEEHARLREPEQAAREEVDDLEPRDAAHAVQGVLDVQPVLARAGDAALLAHDGLAEQVGRDGVRRVDVELPEQVLVRRRRVDLLLLEDRVAGVAAAPRAVAGGLAAEQRLVHRRERAQRLARHSSLQRHPSLHRHSYDDETLFETLLSEAHPRAAQPGRHPRSVLHRQSKPKPGVYIIYLSTGTLSS